jgi:hypothetical protein
MYRRPSHGRHGSKSPCGQLVFEAQEVTFENPRCRKVFPLTVCGMFVVESTRDAQGSLRSFTPLDLTGQ